MKGKAKFKGKGVSHAQANQDASTGYRGGNARSSTGKYGQTANQTRGKKAGYSREH